MDPKIVAIVVFVVAYVLFAFLPTRRSFVAVGASLLLIALGVMSVPTAFTAINWNVMGIFVGTLVLADAFIESRCPAFLAETIVDRSRSTAWALMFICALTSFISAFVENVATVLIVAPIAISLAKKLEMNPVNMMIGIAICSNLQGTATLIGDPPSMLLGGFAKMTFMDFFFYQGKPSIFFAVEFGALFSFVVLYFVFRKHTQKPALVAIEEVKSWWPTILLVALVFVLAASSFLDKGFSYLAGIICLVFGAAAWVWGVSFEPGFFGKSMRRLDWDTTFFLMGIFIIVGGLTATGWIQTMADWISGVVGENVFVGFVLIVFISVVVSAFVDNVPFLAAMLPVGVSLGESMDRDPTLFLFGLLIGASLGGNLTPIGASANIVACGMLRKEGHVVTFRQFGKIAVPFTIASVIPAALFVWFIWS